MPELTGKGLVEYARDKVGTPYFYGCRMEVLTNSKAIELSHSYPSIVTPNYLAKAIARGQLDKINTDCTGLIYGYTKKNLSSSALYSSAYERLPVSRHKDFADGVIVWRQGHAGVFYHNINGEPIVVEAKGINYGTVFSQFKPENWRVALTFKWMTYSYDKSLTPVATWKGQNPYSEPTYLLRKGSKGEAIKWLQWELIESGFDLSGCGGIDGVFGEGTLAAVISFQVESNLDPDGVVGPLTIKALKLDEGEN